MGSVAKGTALSFANTPCVSGASQNLQIKVTGLGGSQSLSWAGAFASGVANNATLSPLTTLSPTSGTISGNGNAVACIGMSIATGSLTAGTTYHGDLRYTQTGGASSNDFPHDYFFKFTVTSAQQAQTITFAQPTSPQAYGSTFHVNPTSSSGLPVSVAASGPCSASAAAPGYDVTMTSGTGTCTLTASQAGDANFTAAQNVVRTVTAQPRPITVTADPKSKVYGQADPALTYEVTSGSLESGDSFTGNLARAAGESVAGSPYAIKQGSLTAGTNYDLTFVGANLTITPHDLHVAAHPQTKVYGQADPELTYTVTQSDLQYSDTNAVVSGSLARNPGQTVAGGPYAITKGSLTANDNYTLLFTGANLTITKAPLTVTADEKAILLNGTVSALTATLTGFQYGETLLTSGVTGTAACTTSDGKSIGTFDIVCRAGTLQASNYSFGPFVEGKLTVTYRWDGYLQPINDTAHQTGVQQSKFKLGQTIPAKFVLKNAAGAVVRQAADPTFSRSGNVGGCDATATTDTTDVVPPNAGVTYAWDGSQYHYNWSTKGLTAGEYRIYANLADGTKQYVDICLAK